MLTTVLAYTHFPTKLKTNFLSLNFHLVQKPWKKKKGTLLLARINRSITQLFNGNSIRWVPISIEDILKLRNNNRIICPKTNSWRCIEVIPYEIAGSNMSSDVTNCIFPMIDPRVPRVDVSCTIAMANRGPRHVVTWHLVVLDLDFPRTFVVFRRRAKNIGVEKRFQILICALDKMSPVGHQ